MTKGMFLWCKRIMPIYSPNKPNNIIWIELIAKIPINVGADPSVNEFQKINKHNLSTYHLLVVKFNLKK